MAEAEAGQEGDGGVWAALAPAASAKGVKDALKERGWLDQTLKVRTRQCLADCTPVAQKISS